MSSGRGTLRIGTSGFGYPSWIPRFYPPGTRPSHFLEHYGARLPACELNGTYRRQPSESTVAAWCAATPASFRFAVKAHAGGSWRSLADPAGLPWLLEPLTGFGERLGAVLFRVPDTLQRDDEKLARLLAAWPRATPLAVEFRHPSWLVDEVFALLAQAGAALCATELDTDPEPPTLRLTGPFLYIRLRRDEYDEAALDEWAARLEPFLADGRDVYGFFRHDETGRAAERALALAARLPDVRDGRSPVDSSRHVPSDQQPGWTGRNRDARQTR